MIRAYHNKLPQPQAHQSALVRRVRLKLILEYVSRSNSYIQKATYCFTYYIDEYIILFSLRVPIYCVPYKIYLIKPSKCLTRKMDNQ